MSEFNSLSSAFTRKSLSIQRDIAIKVIPLIDTTEVYLYSSINYFSDAEVRLVGNFRVKFKNGKYAVLSEAAQFVFKNNNEYNQFSDRQYRTDNFGLYISLDQLSGK